MHIHENKDLTWLAELSISHRADQFIFADLQITMYETITMHVPHHKKTERRA